LNNLEKECLLPILAAVANLPEDTRSQVLIPDPPEGATFEWMGGLAVRLGDAARLLDLFDELTHTDLSLLRRIANLPAVETEGDFDFL
jgi:hypothetical protein